ncbi:MAG: trypsin-like peptidase domain-containing protein [Cyanobacteria bacterium SZAS TMP-1]|nr:trypsin-like peptidase domain-containing protein [Cyanobacteria bacterium SZAS TMP-1]
MPDIPDNVPIYVSSDYGDDDQAEGSSTSAPQMSREQLMNDRSAATWSPFSPGEGDKGAENAASAEVTGGAQVKSDEQLAQSGFQSFRVPRGEDEKVFVLSPRTTTIIAAFTGINFLLIGLWIGSNFIPHEPTVSSLKPGAESLFGALKKGKAGEKTVIDPSNIIAQVVAKAAPSVVNLDVTFNRVKGAINNLNENGSMPQAEASGLIVRNDGYIATNAHVVGGPAGTSELKVTLNNGQTFPGRVIGVDDFSDIAVVKIDATGLPVLPFADQADVHAGDWAIAIGSPLGFDHTVSLGVISAVNRSLAFFNNHVPLIQHDAALNFGNSGGPLLNIRGEVIGLNSAVKEKAQGIGFATPGNVVSEVCQQLIDHGTIPRPFLGIYLVDIEKNPSRSQTLPSHPVAVQVGQIVPEGPALRAGVSSGDIICKINGQEVHSAREVRELVFTHKPGDVLDMEVKRNNAVTICKLTLGDSSKLNIPH